MSAISPYSTARQSIIDRWQELVDRLTGSLSPIEEFELLLAACPFPESPEARYVMGFLHGRLIESLATDATRPASDLDRIRATLSFNGFEIDEARI